MNVLIVMAHPEAHSFNGALRDIAVSVLMQAGHEVRQSDLYAMRFEAVCSPHDFDAPPEGGFFNVQAAQRAAVAASAQSADIAAEQEKLAWAGLVIFIFPLWWFGMPAILKGWIDRVFALGAAYGGGRWFDRGVYRGKRALVCLTTGGRFDRFTATGLFGPLDWILHPLRVGVLNFCGFDTLEPFVAWAAGNVDAAQRERYLDSWRTRLNRIEAEALQPPRHPADLPAPRMRDRLFPALFAQYGEQPVSLRLAQDVPVCGHLGARHALQGRVAKSDRVPAFNRRSIERRSYPTLKIASVASRAILTEER